MAVCFAGSCYRGSEHPEQGEWPPAPPSPALGSTLRTAASSHNSFDRVCEHLGFISIYFGHTLAVCVLRNQKSLRKIMFWIWGCSKKIFPCKLMVITSPLSIISDNKRLQGYTLLLDSRGACIMSRTNEDHDSSYSS